MDANLRRNTKNIDYWEISSNRLAVFQLGCRTSGLFSLDFEFFSSYYVL